MVVPETFFTKGVLNAALSEADKSQHKFRIGAVVFSKKTIISTGRNHPNRSLKHFHPKFYRWKYSVHAEVAAIINARQDLRGKSLLVVRKNKADKLLLTKPCASCMAYIKHVGIRRIYYSTNETSVFGVVKL